MAFSSRNYNALMVDIMTKPHRPVNEAAPGVDRNLSVLVEGCLVKDREHRIGSASELAERLAAVARRLSRAEEAELEGPRRRSTDRLPPVRGVVGAFERPSVSVSRAEARERARSQRRVASYAGLAGLVVGAAAVYALVTWRAGGESGEGRGAPRAAEATPSPAGADPSAVAQRTKSR
jgi:serine/threonine-protein kinase